MKTTTEFKLVDINKLIPYVNNARTHSKEQIAKLRSSLREFGFVSPAIIDKDYNILCGHGRVEAAKAEGIKQVPCVFVEHLTEAQKKAYILADNRMALDAGWDDELLRVEMEALKGFDFNLELTGFDEKELSKLFTDATGAEEDDFDVDGELDKPKMSKLGDVWTLGRHKVICGDSTDPKVFNKLLGEKKINLVVTDPPYGVAYENASGRIKNDDLNDKEMYNFLLKAFTNLHDAMAKDASMYFFYASAKTRVFHDAAEDAGLKMGGGLVWKKDQMVLTRTDWKYIHEPLSFLWRKDGKHVWYGDQKQKTVFEFARIKDSKKEGFGHSTSKPVPLIAYLISLSSQTNGLVLDGFLGSASTLIAADELDRICYGVELEEKFVDVAVERYRKYCTDHNKKAEVTLERGEKKYTYEEAKALMEAQ